MKSKINENLKKHKKKSISLLEIQRLFPPSTEYNEISKIIKELEKAGIIRPIKAHGTNNRSMALYNSYRINKAYFKEELIEELQVFKLRKHEAINVDIYTRLGEARWNIDKPYIEAVNTYLMEKGLPKNIASSPERSYELVGDEKWIDFQGGKSVLENIILWDKLKISYNKDPLMIAINPSSFIKKKKSHKHMIVENKASFYHFLSHLSKTDFTSLIFGSGWKIVSNIGLLGEQIGLVGCNHELSYFGDLDYEGVSIYYALSKENEIDLAIEFYKELLKKKFTKGKEGQRRNEKAIDYFLRSFSLGEQKTILNIFKNGGYYPQEGLSEKEIGEIWRKNTWTYL